MCALPIPIFPRRPVRRADRRVGGVRWAAVLALAVFAAFPAATRAEQKPTGKPTCHQKTAAEEAVEGVLDGRTFVLVGGRTIRLNGVLIPVTVEDEAKALLDRLVAGRAVRVLPQGDADRYGRVSAVVFAGEEGGSVQAALLRAGLALGARSSSDCAAEWRENERFARDAKLGLWADPYYQVAGADDHKTLSAARGRFTLAQGRVVSVRESGGLIYLNFGRRWAESLSVGVPKRSESAFTTAGVPLKQLQGRVLRVRGWVETRAGPFIEATSPEQIEVVAQK